MAWTCTRQKMEHLGARALQDEELLTLVLGGRSLPLARRLAAQGLGRLAQMTLEELRTTPGLGPARAAALGAGLELGKRLLAPGGPPVTCAEEAYYLVRDMASLKKEHFRALYLDARRRLLQAETISIGTLTASLVHPREVFQPAVELSAAGLVVVHNHPSGDPSPSPEDLALTRRLRQAGDILGIELLDHLVVGRAGFVSLKQRGEL